LVHNGVYPAAKCKRVNETTGDASDIMQNMIARRGRWAAVLLVVALSGAAVFSISAIRRPILRAAGWALVLNEHVEPADVIVVASDADGAGVLEAADLVHSGVTTRVAVFADPPDAVDREFIRRGLPYEDAAARSFRQLRALGVDTIDYIPRNVAGTEDEGRVLSRLVRPTRIPLSRGGEQCGSLATSPASVSSFHEGPPDESHCSLRALLVIRSRPMVGIARRDPN
jgi:hypothetical protein